MAVSLSKASVEGWTAGRGSQTEAQSLITVQLAKVN